MNSYIFLVVPHCHHESVCTKPYEPLTDRQTDQIGPTRRYAKAFLPLSIALVSLCLCLYSDSFAAAFSPFSTGSIDFCSALEPAAEAAVDKASALTFQPRRPRFCHCGRCPRARENSSATSQHARPLCARGAHALGCLSPGLVKPDYPGSGRERAQVKLESKWFELRMLILHSSSLGLCCTFWQLPMYWQSIPNMIFA